MNQSRKTTGTFNIPSSGFPRQRPELGGPRPRRAPAERAAVASGSGMPGEPFDGLRRELLRRAAEGPVPLAGLARLEGEAPSLDLSHLGTVWCLHGFGTRPSLDAAAIAEFVDWLDHEAAATGRPAALLEALLEPPTRREWVTTRCARRFAGALLASSARADVAAWLSAALSRSAEHSARDKLARGGGDAGDGAGLSEPAVGSAEQEAAAAAAVLREEGRWLMVDEVYALHRLFGVGSRMHVTAQTLLNVLQAAGEGAGLTSLESHAEDDLVPLGVASAFAEEALAAMAALLGRVGASEGQEGGAARRRREGGDGREGRK